MSALILHVFVALHSTVVKQYASRSAGEEGEGQEGDVGRRSCQCCSRSPSRPAEAAHMGEEAGVEATGLLQVSVAQGLHPLLLDSLGLHFVSEAGALGELRRVC